MKNLKMRTIGSIVLAMSVSATCAGLSQAQSFSETLAGAYNGSGLIQQYRALLRAADEDVAKTASELKPIINWSSGFNHEFGQTRQSSMSRNMNVESDSVSLGLTASLLVYDFGGTKSRLKAAEETVLATRETLRGIEQQVLLRAVRAYMDVLRSKEFLELRDNNLALLEGELNAAINRYDAGAVTRTDVALAEARLASAKSGLATAEGNLLQSIEEYQSVSGITLEELETPNALPEISSDVENSKSIALRNHPDMLGIQHEVAAAELAVAAAKAGMSPELSIIGGLSGTEYLGDSRFSRSGRIGVEIKGPIYRGGLKSANLRQSIARRDSLRGRLHEVQRRVIQDVSNAHAMLGSAQASLEAIQEQVMAANIAFNGVREEANLGARTTLDVLNAEQELLEAEANLISAEADVYILAYSLLEKMGLMTARDLNLNVQTYDPAAYYELVKNAPVQNSPQGRKLDRILRAIHKE